MNIALIFAGGAGVRMNAKTRPKQFLELNGKPIIIYTLEVFEKHLNIDGIVVVCIEEWIPYLNRLIEKYEITKVKSVVAGGDTGQLSIYNGLVAISDMYDDNTTVLIHDGVRPLIDEKTISDNIEVVKECGSCITCIPTTETFIVKEVSGFLTIPERDNSLVARAPQSFILKNIVSAHQKAISEGRSDFIDSCSLMNHYGYKLSTTIGSMENIKITTPTDFFIFRALSEVRENNQIFGY